MDAWIAAHAWAGPVALWIFAAAVHAMPAPAQNASQFYTWLYNFLQFLGANMGNLGKKQA